MKTEKDWIEFLKMPDHLACALEVGSHYVSIKHAVHNDLYKRLGTGLETHLKKHSALKEWKIERADAAEKWAAVCIEPCDHPEGCSGVYVRLERCDLKTPRMILGVGTYTGFSALGIKLRQPLVDAMEAHDFNLTHKGWVRRRWMEYYPDEHEFCVDAMASTRIEKDLLVATCDVFDEFRNLMERINKDETARFKSSGG